MVNVETADERQLAELKTWFFKENIRLNEEREAIDRERERMKRENELFEKKLDVLKKELYKLAVEKKSLEQERIRLQFMQERLKKEAAAVPAAQKGGLSLLFSGVGNEAALKKRYRDLLKIFHPDNMNGDTDAVQYINREFNNLRKKMQ